MSPLDRWRKALDVISTVVVLIVCAVLLWRIWPGQASNSKAAAAFKMPTRPISLVGAQTKGSSSARFGLLMFMDYNCPFCRQFFNGPLAELERQYVRPGVLLLAFRHLPLTKLHPGAVALAEGATCAGRQGRFWDASQELYRAPKVEPSVLPDLAQQLHLDIPQFVRCSSGEAVEQVRKDMLIGHDLAVNSTPRFFVGTIDGSSLKATTTLVGAEPLVVFQKAIEETLAKAK